MPKLSSRREGVRKPRRGSLQRETEPPEDQDREYEMVRAKLEPFDPVRWEAAMEQKRAMPRFSDSLADPGSAIFLAAGKEAPGIFLAEHGGKADVRSWIKPPAHGSFGFVGAFVAVSARKRQIQGTLAVSFDARRLGYVGRDSLRLFRFDDELKRFEVVPGSAVSRDGDYVYGRISAPGKYAVIGINAHPLLQHAAKTICSITSLASALPSVARDGLSQRICQLILCAPDLWSAAADPRVLDALTTRLADEGVPVPDLPGDGWFGPIPPGGGPVPGDICDECLHLPSGGDLPECQIFDGPRHGSWGGGCSDPGWTSVGPINLSGCVKQVVVDPSDADRLYCAASNGGVWTLADVNAYPSTSWQPLTDQLDNLTMPAVAVAPSDGRVVYTANALNYLYRSDDRGATWARTSSTNLGAVRRVLVHPHDARTVFVASSSGLRVSFDGGAVWQTQYSGDLTDSALDPDDTSIIYIAERGVGLRKSTTLGLGPWATMLPWSRATSPSSTMTKIALGRVRGGTSETDTTRTVVVKFASEVFINRRGGRDRGTDWVSAGARGGNGYGDWCHAVAVDPFDADVILAGQQELFRTDDGGGTWTTVASYYAPHEDQQSIAFDPVHRNVVYLSNDGGVFRSIDDGVTWIGSGTSVSDEIVARRNLSRDLATAEFYRVGLSGNRALGNLYHSGIIGSSAFPSGTWDGVEGHAWEFNNVYADPKRPTRFYVFGGSLIRRRYPGLGTQDFAQFGAFVPHAGAAQGAIGVDTRTGSNTIIAGADADGVNPARLMIALDGDREPILAADGATWTNLPAWAVAFTNGTDQLVAVSFAPSAPGKAYVISDAGLVFRKADVNTAGGWAQPGQWATSGVRHLAVNGVNDDRLYAITSGRVARSPDGGASWVEVGTGTLPASPFHSIVAHPWKGTTLYVAAENGVYVSTDEGDTWGAYDQRLPNAAVQQLYWSGGSLYAVTHGRGIWRRTPC